MGIRLVVRSSWTQRTDATRAQYEFEQPRIVVGRSAGADIRLPHPAVSSSHASIRSEGTQWLVVDEGSTNGTKVNGKKVVPKRPKALRSGDRIEIGGFTLDVELGVIAPSTSPERTAELARRLLRDALSPEEIDAPRLRVLNGPAAQRVLELPEAPSSVVLGRGEDCDLTLPDEDASRTHIEVLRRAGEVRVRDLESKNGITINGEAALEAELRDRDEIRIGNTLLAFEDPAAAKLEEVAAEPDAEVELPEPAEETDEDENVTEESPQRDIPTEPTEPADETPPPELQVLQPKARERAPADVLVYILAGAVLALSVAGLIWLFG